MGCITSTNKLAELKSDNTFRVRAFCLQDDRLPHKGYLELNQRELVFTASGVKIVWALQHLRRYGLNNDNFSFEAGRRCMSGPGIFSFRVQQQQQELYELFQTYVNAVNSVTDDVFGQGTGEHPSHLLGRPESNSSSNNYLEPAPMRNINLDSPDSPTSLTNFTTEVVNFQNNQISSSSAGGATNSSTMANSNIYMEQPLRLTRHEHNNNKMTSVITSGAGVGVSGGGYRNTFNALTRKALFKGSSLDVPPEELAPVLCINSQQTNHDPLHMYANVNGLGSGGRIVGITATNSNSIKMLDMDTAERCYENLSPLDLTLLLQSAAAAAAAAGIGATTPGAIGPTSSTAVSTSTANTPVDLQPNGGVNYIVLDLDQPRTPSQFSPKTCFDSQQGQNLLFATNEYVAGAAAGDPEVQSLPAVLLSSMTMPTTKREEALALQQHQQRQQHQRESSMGYSTIDFIKTCALFKSAQCSDFDMENDHHDEESRKTRHSKGVRKAYSISE